MIKLLFLEDSSSLCYSNSLSILLYYFFYPPLLWRVFHIIQSFPSHLHRTVVYHPTHPALKYVSYQASSLALCERQWLRTLFRGLLHINAARKATAVHLMRWWQLFPKIFLYPYLLRMCLRSILIVGVSWKIAQVTWMPARLIFVRSEEGVLLGPRPSTLS